MKAFTEADQKGRTMRKMALLIVGAMLLSQPTVAHVVRHAAMPEGYWGRWAPGNGSCGDSDQSAIVLTAKSYAGPAGSCAIEYVSETATPRGPMYSARLRCSGTGARLQNSTAANLMIRPLDADHISAGPTFGRLKPHHRCTAVANDAKELGQHR